METCAPFTNCMGEINNTQINDAKDIDVVMLMYNLMECSIFKIFRKNWKFMRIL